MQMHANLCFRGGVTRRADSGACDPKQASTNGVGLAKATPHKVQPPGAGGIAGSSVPRALANNEGEMT
jgi:hypothetical protein